jgi:hypothetical protein
MCCCIHTLITLGSTNLAITVPILPELAMCSSSDVLHVYIHKTILYNITGHASLDTNQRDKISNMYGIGLRF